MKDTNGRQIDYLRISLTDRCNLRCIYCMPLEGAPPIAQADILTYEEILRVVRASAELGIKKIRLTGGEPLIRKEIVSIVRAIKSIEGIEEVSVTTNGVLLYDMIDELASAGLDRVNLSIDSLKKDLFKTITREADLDLILKGMNAALDLGIKVRINVVLLKHMNDGEVLDFVDMIYKYPVDVRFIELMPIGMGTEFEGVNNNVVIGYIQGSGYDLHEVKHKAGSGPARYFELEGAKGDLGFISPMSHQFCDTCNRIRLTPEGFLKLCLHSGRGIDLRALMRKGLTDETLLEVLRASIERKPEAHHFNEYLASGHDVEIDKVPGGRDKRHMNQIGG